MSNPVVLYLCDRKACKNCSLECMHTSDVTHAINFTQLNNSDGRREYIEKQELEMHYWKKVNAKRAGDKNG